MCYYPCIHRRCAVRYDRYYIDVQTSHICGSPYLPTSDDWVLQGVPSDSSSKKTDEWVPAKTRYGHTIGRKDGAYDPSSGATIKWSDLVATEVEEDDITVTSSNYYEVLNKVKVLQEFNDSLSEYLNVGAGIGGGFANTNELRVMGYHEAINGPDSELWSVLGPRTVA